jgi:hypothetical protein
MDERLRQLVRLLEGEQAAEQRRDFEISLKIGYKNLSRRKDTSLEGLDR